MCVRVCMCAIEAVSRVSTHKYYMHEGIRMQSTAVSAMDTHMATGIRIIVYCIF